MFRNTLVTACTVGMVGMSFFAGTGTAQAEQVKVSYYASELATAEGVASVSNRIDRKVRRACRPSSLSISRRLARKCRVDLTSQLVTKINNPVLTAIYSGQKPYRIAMRNDRNAR